MPPNWCSHQWSLQQSAWIVSEECSRLGWLGERSLHWYSESSF
jgi:hypothetical protein